MKIKEAAGAVCFFAFFSSCCLGICRPVPLESTVDVPVTLAGVKRLHAPPNVVVTVERKTRTAGGGGCGHSPLCLIFVPFMIAEVLFPEQWDEAHVVDNGKETYRASFATNGDFLQARVTKDGVVRDLRQLKLDRLHRRVVVESARGSEGEEPRPVSINAQIDLIAAYTKAIDDESGEDRGLLLAEALAWLDEEAAPLVLSRLGSTTEPDEAKAAVATRLCLSMAPSMSSMFSRAVVELAKQPQQKTAIAMLQCAEDQVSSASPRLNGETMMPFASVVVDGLCKDEPASRADYGKALTRLGEKSPNDKGPLRTKIKACTNAPVRAGMLTAIGDTVSEPELIAALSTWWGNDIVKTLKPDDEVHRRVLVHAIATDNTASNAIEKASSAASSSALPPALNDAIAQRAVKGFGTLFCSPHQDRARAFGVLDVGRRTGPSVGAHKGGSDMTSAKNTLLALRKTAKQEQQPFVEAGLVAVGADAEANVAVLLRPLSAGTQWDPSTICADDQVIADVLDGRGCTRDDVEAMKKQNKLVCKELK